MISKNRKAVRLASVVAGLAVLSAFVAASAPSGFAQAQFARDGYSGLYLGGRLSYTNVSVAQRYTNADDGKENFSYRSVPVSLSAIAGYKYNAYLGAEAAVYFPITTPAATFVSGGGRADLDKPDGYNNSDTSNVYTTTENGRATYGVGYAVALVGSYPLSPDFSIYVKLGVGGATVGGERVRFKDDTGSDQEITIELNQGLVPVGFSFGGGVSYRAGSHVTLSVEFEQTVVGGIGDVNVSSVSMNNFSLSAAFNF